MPSPKAASKQQAIISEGRAAESWGACQWSNGSGQVELRLGMLCDERMVLKVR